MGQRVFVNVVGFTDVERHALNSLFRLSEDHQTTYSLWQPRAPQAARLALVDGQSYEARVEAAALCDDDMAVIWVGDSPPASAIRSFGRPIPWPEIVQAMDDLVDPMSEPIHVDIDFDSMDTRPPDTVPPDLPPPRRALIVNADRDERLYLRARLALARLSEADEAESAAQALELARDNRYLVAVVDFDLPDLDGCALVKRLAEGSRPIAKLVLTKQRPSLAERLRARFAGAAGLIEKPAHPGKLQALLQKV